MISHPIDISLVFGGGNDTLIIRCLESIKKNYTGLARMYIVSNTGSAGTVALIKKNWPDTVLVVNDKAKGFAENHNEIIRRSRNPYILILNDDTVILPGALEKMAGYLDQNPRVAAVSPKLLNPDGSLQQSTYSFPNLFTALVNFSGIRNLIPFNKFTYAVARPFLGSGKSRFWNHDKTCVVDTVRGACVLMRRAAINEVGLMDEVCRAYGEETEWHYRFKKSGWKVVFLHDAEIVHYGQQTTSKKPIKEEEVKGALNYFKKHKSKLDFCLFTLSIAVIFIAKGCFSAIFFRWDRAKINFKIAGNAVNYGNN